MMISPNDQRPTLFYKTYGPYKTIDTMSCVLADAIAFYFRGLDEVLKVYFQKTDSCYTVNVELSDLFDLDTDLWKCYYLENEVAAKVYPGLPVEYTYSYESPEVGTLIFERPEDTIQIKVDITTRLWLKRLWRFPGVWRQHYQVFRKHYGRLQSLYFGFSLARLTLKRY